MDSPIDSLHSSPAVSIRSRADSGASDEYIQSTGGRADAASSDTELSRRPRSCDGGATGAVSDSEVFQVDGDSQSTSSTSRIARQVKGPSSECLEFQESNPGQDGLRNDLALFCMLNDTTRRKEHGNIDGSDSDVEDEVKGYLVDDTVDASVDFPRSVDLENNNKDVNVRHKHSTSRVTKKADHQLVKRGWEDILGTGELYRWKVNTPTGGDPPKRGDRVYVSTRGFLENDGGEIDVHDEFSFLVGYFEVIHGWDIAIQTMRPGDSIRILCSPRFAYGELGRLPDIPGNSRILYEFELLRIEPGLLFQEIDLHCLIRFCDNQKARGNYHYERGEYDASIGCYKVAIDGSLEWATAQGGGDMDARWNNMQAVLNNNAAAAQMKLADYDGALVSLQECLSFDSSNVKALYRIGRCQIALGRYDCAVDILSQAASIDSASVAIRRELGHARIKQRNTSARERKMYRRMLTHTDDPMRTYFSLLKQHGVRIIVAIICLIVGLISVYAACRRPNNNIIDGPGTNSMYELDNVLDLFPAPTHEE